MFQNRFYFAGLLIAVSVATVILTAIGGLAVSAAGGLSQDTAPAPPAPIPRVSEKLRNDLDKAFNPEFAFNFDAVGNPFSDKTNVSAAQTAGQSNLPGQTGGGGGGAVSFGANRMMPPNGAAFQPGMRLPMPDGMPPAQPTPAQITPLPETVAKLPVLPDTKELVRERNRNIKLGRSVGEIAGVYSIDEVRPYGTIGSGETNFVKLYAKSTKDRFMVGRGTRFRDGVIESLSDEGVTFRRDSGEAVFSKWLRSTKAETDSAVLRASPNQP